MNQCFLMETATNNLLTRVTNVCAECYNDIQEGDTIFYDNSKYHYVCQSCQELACQQMNNECEITHDDDGGLFC